MNENVKSEWMVIPCATNYEINIQSQIRNRSTKYIITNIRKGKVQIRHDSKTIQVSAKQLADHLFREICGWKSCPSFSNLEAHTDGRVRSIHNGKIRTPILADSGYLQTSSSGQVLFIHSVVCDAHIGPRPPKKTINHIDGNKQDNNISNLEYMTPKEQAIHRSSLKKVSRTKKLPRIVQYVNTENDKKIIKIYETVEDVVNFLQVRRHSVMECLRRDKMIRKTLLCYEEDPNISLPNEEWRVYKINGVDTTYSVSNMGRLKTIYGGVSDLSHREKRKYVDISISHNGQSFKTGLHRMVAKCFLENPNNLDTVDHLDKNTHNNKVTNLEWISSREQSIRATGKVVFQYDLEHNFIKKFRSTVEVSESLNLGVSSIRSCCKGRIDNYGGYIWRYEPF